MQRFITKFFIHFVIFSVYMSIDTFKKQTEKNKIHDTLLNAELELQASGITYDIDDVFGKIKKKLEKKANV